MSYLATRNVTIPASGVGSVVIGPDGAHDSWRVLAISVVMSGAGTLLGEARVYLGDALDSNYLEGTYDGARDTSPQSPPLILNPGEYLTVRWTDATVGAVATANVRYDLVR